MNLRGFKKYLPNSFAFAGLLLLIYPFIVSSLYHNLILAVGLLFLFLSWLGANLIKANKLSPQWKQQKKVMIGLSLGAALGFSMLAYYEIQMPKYKVARIAKELYRVPPQLSKKQLIELGRECNTYGNTLCSHDVFAKIVSLDSRNYKALANLAMAQSHLGFHKYAIINFKRAIKNGVKAYDVYKSYGNSLKVLKYNSSAIQAYKQSLKINPNQDSLHRKIKTLELNL